MRQMRRFVETCEAVGATTKKLAKVALVSELLQSLPIEDATLAAIFLTGRAFPSREERVLGVGGVQLARVVAELANANEADLGRTYREHGDLGDMAEHLPCNTLKKFSISWCMRAPRLRRRHC
jgi:DNA ligase-1